MECRTIGGNIHYIHIFSVLDTLFPLLVFAHVIPGILNSKEGTLMSTELHDIADDLFYDVDRYSKGITCVRTCGGSNGGIDTDQLTLGDDKGAAAVAGIDGGVGRDKGFNRGLALTSVDVERAAFGADDTSGDCCFQREGIANGQYPLTDLYFIGVTIEQERK